MRTESPAKHAAKMVLRNLRSYAMLSITIVFSFSVLLGYLAFTDAALYNAYKEIFAAPREVVLAYDINRTGILDVLVRQTAGESASYRYFETTVTLSQYGHIWADVSILPDHTTQVFRDISDGRIFENYTIPVHIVQGEGFPLSGRRAIVNESFFRAISPEGELPTALSLPVRLADGSTVFWETEVVGVCADVDEAPLGLDDQGKPTGQSSVYVSAALLGDLNAGALLSGRDIAVFQSETPETVAGLAQNLDVVLHAVCLAQNEATRELRIRTEGKFLLAAALYVLLAVNLFGCFSNALSERRFEIGVKRAIGAPARSIIGQFLLESLLVMAGNTLLAVLLTAQALAGYKLWQRLAFGNHWIVRVSAASIGMFAVCALGLTLVFSLFFADRATRVEIVRYLKAE